MNNKSNWISFLIIFTCIVGVIVSCSFSASGPYIISSDSIKKVPASSSIEGASSNNQLEQTAEKLCNSGKAVYASVCLKCHGTLEQPGMKHPLTGPNAGLSKYVTARGLLDYTKFKMPPAAPNSLSTQSYLQIIACILLENKYILPGTSLTLEQLDTIMLTR